MQTALLTEFLPNIAFYTSFEQQPKIPVSRKYSKTRDLKKEKREGKKNKTQARTPLLLI